jgi:quercetin dioxygenase-like cupin family protein
MMIRVMVAVVVAILVGGTWLPAWAQQPAPAGAPKGVTSRNLVTSLGGFSATVNAPILLTGSTVTLEPGGQTGREQFRVPTFIYVLEGILTTFYEAGPVGIAGTQYHSAGQSFMDNAGWWHNYTNTTGKPVKLLMLHVGYPGRPDPVQKPEAE